ncbi:MAG: hypothetical protein ACOCWG_01470 [bacterium]
MTKYTLIRHSPTIDAIKKTIKQTGDNPVVIAFAFNDDADKYYDKLKSIGYKDVVRIPNRNICPEIIRNKKESTVEDNFELTTISCVQCFGKRSKLSKHIDDNCESILNSKSISEYQDKFKKAISKPKNVCPHRLTVKLLEHLKKRNKQIILTTHRGLYYYTFLHKFIKENTSVIIENANKIKDLALKEYVLSDKTKRGIKNSDVIKDFVKRELTTLHIDSDSFSKIGLDEKYCNLFKTAIKTIPEYISNKATIHFEHKEIKKIKDIIKKNIDEKKFPSAYFAYTLYKGVDFIETVTNNNNHVELIRTEENNKKICKLIIREIIAGIETRVTHIIEKADTLYLLESYTPNKKYYRFYYGIKPDEIIDWSDDKKQVVYFIGGKSNLKLLWKSKSNTMRLINAIESIKDFRGIRPIFIFRNRSEVKKINELVDFLFATHSRGNLKCYQGLENMPVSVGLPFTDRKTEKLRKHNIENIIKSKINFDDYYFDLSLTEFMKNVSFNKKLYFYSVGLNVRKENIDKIIKANMPWSKNVEFVQLGSLSNRTENYGLQISNAINNRKSETRTENRIKSDILNYVEENGKITANIVDKKIKGKKSTKNKVLKEMLGTELRFNRKKKCYFLRADYNQVLQPPN